ncbi:unnamed protein product [Rhizophagus irregularis]|nr:unnamed protein product [Rhizophagus irregularis]
MIEFILKQENIALDEIEIWNNLIKWSYAQNPNIDQDPLKWTNDDIEIMKRTTHRLIPLIRFQDISSDDYYEKVFPYEELLPKKLKGEIMQFYLVGKINFFNFYLFPTFQQTNIIWLFITVTSDH